MIVSSLVDMNASDDGVEEIGGQTYDGGGRGWGDSYDGDEKVRMGVGKEEDYDLDFEEAVDTEPLKERD